MPEMWWQGFISGIVFMILLALIVLSFGSAIKAGLSDARERKEEKQAEDASKLNTEETARANAWCSVRADMVMERRAAIHCDTREEQA